MSAGPMTSAAWPGCGASGIRLIVVHSKINKQHSLLAFTLAWTKQTGLVCQDKWARPPSLSLDRNSWRPTFLDLAYKIDRRI
jgi:hypothetical protein